MVEAMVQGATSEIQIWVQKVAEASGEVEIDVELGLHKIAGRIPGRVISLAAFRDDFEKGELIFKFQRLLAKEAMQMYQTTGFWLIPGYRNLATQGNRLMNLYSSKVDALLHDGMTLSMTV